MNRSKVLQTANQELGVTESPPNSNKSKYGAWYGSGLDGQKWCAMFVSWVFDQAGLPLGHIQTRNGIHHCQSAFNYYKSKSLVTNSPQPGDIVIFDWEGNGYADHIGIFNQWANENKTIVETYEGNTSAGNDSDGGKVMLRKRSRNLVKGFISPNVYTGAQITSHDVSLEIGERGSDVTVLQKYLFELGYEIVVDGWYGQETARLVKEFQQLHLMNATGKADLVTVGALQEASNERKIAKAKLLSGSYLKKGSAGILVTDIQKSLNKKNTQLDLTVNGVFDDPTYRAVKAFQQKNHLQSDGIVGPVTFGKLGIS